MPSTAELLALAIAVATGALVQGTIGFGFALVSAPVLALIEPSAVPATLLLLAVPINLTVFARDRHALDRRGVGEVVAGMVAGTALAVLVLRGIPERHLTVAFGAAVVLSAIASALRAPRAPAPAARLAAGVGAGVINTVVGTGGPLIALVYRSRPGPVLRSTLAATFAIAVGLSMGGLALAERLSWSQVVLALILVPPLVVGLAASAPAARRLDHEWLQRSVLAFVFISGIATIARGL